MDREALRAAKAQMLAHMQAGQSWHEAATNASLQTSRPVGVILTKKYDVPYN